MADVVRINPRSQTTVSVGLSWDEAYQRRDRLETDSLAAGSNLYKERYAVRIGNGPADRVKKMGRRTK